MKRPPVIEIKVMVYSEKLQDRESKMEFSSGNALVESCQVDTKIHVLRDARGV